MSTRLLTLAILAGALLPAHSLAQASFPERPIRVIVPFPAGGPTDVLARALSEAFRQRTGQPFVVESRPGANTTIAALACKSATPDGYTLCLLGSTSMSLNPHMQKNLRYSRADIIPVTNIAMSRAAFLVHKDVPVNTLAELVEYSKKHPEKMNYASFGAGSELHHVMEWFKKKTGAQITHVPFQGFAPALQAFDRGDIQILLPSVIQPIVHRIEQKQAKALFILNDFPADNLPGVPPVSGVGLPPIGFQTWFGMLAPAGTPNALVEKLSADLRAIVADKVFADKFIRGIGLVPVTNTPAEFATFLDQDYINAGELVKVSGVTLPE